MCMRWNWIQHYYNTLCGYCNLCVQSVFLFFLLGRRIFSFLLKLIRSVRNVCICVVFFFLLLANRTRTTTTTQMKCVWFTKFGHFSVLFMTNYQKNNFYGFSFISLSIICNNKTMNILEANALSHNEQLEKGNLNVVRSQSRHKFDDSFYECHWPLEMR